MTQDETAAETIVAKLRPANTMKIIRDKSGEMTASKLPQPKKYHKYIIIWTLTLSIIDI